MKKKEVSWPGATDHHKQEIKFNHKDYRRHEMHKEETKDKGAKAKSTDFGFAPTSDRMLEMMNTCCAGRGGFPYCSTGMEGMMKAMTKQHCCTTNEDATESERRKK